MATGKLEEIILTEEQDKEFSNGRGDMPETQPEIQEEVKEGEE